MGLSLAWNEVELRWQSGRSDGRWVGATGPVSDERSPEAAKPTSQQSRVASAHA